MNTWERDKIVRLDRVTVGFVLLSEISTATVVVATCFHPSPHLVEMDSQRLFVPQKQERMRFLNGAVFPVTEKINSSWKEKLA
ncbi:hypothetical protein SUGI_0002250 [Cryptomeria japonica]|nr:hypothetical protein SUGI_0002250 [Cryptomeria japonica]